MKLRDVRQLPLWAPHSDWRPLRAAQLPSWAGARRVGLDIETHDPDLKALGPGEYRPGTFVAGFSIAIEDGPKHYIPLRHEGGDNVDNPDQALNYLRDQVRDFRGEIVGANLSYEHGFLSVQEGVDFSSIGWFRDVQVADPLINELQMRYSLDAIAQRWGIPGKNESLLREAARHYGVDPKASMWRLPARYVGYYAEQDAVLPLQLLRRQERTIERDELREVFDLESKVQHSLMRLRMRGIRIAEDRLGHIEEWSLAQEAEALGKIAMLTGVRIAVGEVWQAGALAPALTACGVTVPVTMGRGSTPSPSIDKNLLKGLQDRSKPGDQVHEVAAAMSWARRTNKLRTTFASSIRTYMVNGRVRCSYNQLRRTEDSTDEERGAAYGRLSSEHPNLQQQPSRDEFAAMWRSIYLPEEGALFGSCDFSQQEPRVLCHYADVCGLEGAAAAAQKYRDDPTIDNHQMMADLTGVKRGYAKELLLGRSYGMGGAKMSRKLGLPTRWAVFYQRRTGKETSYFERADEAQGCARDTGGQAWEVAGAEGQAILDQFDSKLPFIKALAKKCESVAKERGYIKTLSGRRCRFPREGNKWGWTHKALNRLIQGSSADQTKKAVVDADAAGLFLQIQVHDEIDGSFGTEAEAIRLAEVMRDTYKLRVPMKVDVEIGPSWGEAKKIDRCVI
jgi:DNA polymerase I-like protein with 3'-5' exonuclease and polymerase domains